MEHAEHLCMAGALGVILRRRGRHVDIACLDCRRNLQFSDAPE